MRIRNVKPLFSILFRIPNQVILTEVNNIMKGNSFWILLKSVYFQKIKCYMQLNNKLMLNSLKSFEKV